eukprot:5367194-Amphidinium_carterae.1
MHNSFTEVVPPSLAAPLAFMHTVWFNFSAKSKILLGKQAISFWASALASASTPALTYDGDGRG